MTGRLALILVAALAAATVATSTANAEQRGRTVSMSGCTRFTPPFCTALRDYALITNGEHIPFNTGVTVRGWPSGDVTPCGLRSFRVVSWKQIRLHCPQ
jgi:hypothetical protein